MKERKENKEKRRSATKKTESKKMETKNIKFHKMLKSFIALAVVVSLVGIHMITPKEVVGFYDRSSWDTFYIEAIDETPSGQTMGDGSLEYTIQEDVTWDESAHETPLETEDKPIWNDPVEDGNLKQDESLDQEDNLSTRPEADRLEERDVTEEEDLGRMEEECEEECEDEAFKKLSALSSCGSVVEYGNFAGVSAGNSPTGMAIPGAQWVLCECGIVTVGGGGLQMPDNTNTLTQSAFPAVIRPFIRQVIFTEPITAGTSLQCLFNGLPNLTSIQNLGYLDTSRVRNFRRMFMDTPSLGSLDLSMMNTQSATNMYRMFMDTGLVHLNVGGNFNTGGLVTNMGSMFWGARNLVSIGDVSNWDTGNVTRMSRMFQGARNLAHVDVSNWNTGSVIQMYNMFHDASSLTSIDVSRWNVSHVMRMDVMFSGATGLTHLNLSGWNTASLSRMDNMFDGASNLIDLNLAGFDTNLVVNRNNIFRGLNNLRVLTLGTGWYWNVFNVTGLANPPSNEQYYGGWRNVGTGTIHNPMGEHTPSSGLLADNSLFPGGIANVWVWNPRVPVTHPVTFVLNGGDVNGNTDDVVHQVNKGEGITVENVPVPLREGWVFQGWTQEDLGELLSAEDVGDYIVTGSRTFNAQWEEYPHGSGNGCEECEEYPCDCGEGWNECEGCLCDCTRACAECEQCSWEGAVNCEQCKACNEGLCGCDVNSNRRPNESTETSKPHLSQELANNPAPETGDQANMNLWIMIFSVGLIGFILVFRTMTIENKKKK